MQHVIRKCDIMITPVVDPEQASWSCTHPLPSGGWLDAYHAAAWVEYWERAWCRVEAMLCAAIPVDDKEARKTCFRGAMSNAIAAGRRPHAIYGDKEAIKDDTLRFLSPLLHSTYHKFKPVGRMGRISSSLLLLTPAAHAAAAKNAPT
jgi:hypothetical protein